MTRKVIPGALAGATGVKKPDYAIAAAFFNIMAKLCVCQVNALSVFRCKPSSREEKGLQCK